MQTLSTFPIKVLYGENNTFIEVSATGEIQGWKRLLSGYYIKLSLDWVPGEVIHQHLRTSPMQVQPLEGELEDERLVQHWYECIVGKETSEKSRSSFSMQNDQRERQKSQVQQNRKPHQPTFQKQSV